MMGESTWPWLALAALGAYHGLNPAMGWLFAVALGLQEQRGSAVLRALPPIALGYAFAITLAVVAFGVLLGLSPNGHAGHLSGSATLFTDLAAVGLHTLAMFAVMGVVALVVYEKLGVMVLKRAWFNVDLVWAGALIAAGVRCSVRVESVSRARGNLLPARGEVANGRYRWVVLAMNVGAQATFLGAVFQGLPALEPVLRAAYGLSLGQLGLVLSSVAVRVREPPMVGAGRAPEGADKSPARDPKIRRIAATGAMLPIPQFGVVAFLVVFVHEERGYAVGTAAGSAQRPRVISPTSPPPAPLPDTSH